MPCEFGLGIGARVGLELSWLIGLICALEKIVKLKIVITKISKKENLAKERLKECFIKIVRNKKERLAKKLQSI